MHIDERAKYYGVRGWLLFFCVISVLYFPAEVLNHFAQAPKGIYAAIRSILAALSFNAGVRLFFIKASGIEWVRLFFVLRLIVGIVLLWGIMQSAGIATDRFFTELATLGSLIAWWSYFRYSRRVRVTYGRNI